jgi:hypothetical protein
LKRKASAGIAQLVEQRTENPRVTGSNPVPGTYGKLLEIIRLQGVSQYWIIENKCSTFAVNVRHF